MTLYWIAVLGLVFMVLLGIAAAVIFNYRDLLADGRALFLFTLTAAGLAGIYGIWAGIVLWSAGWVQ